MSEQADHAIETLHQLKKIGVRLSLDDFGTGYSSLSYLQSFPVDVVKIAKPFIDDLESSDSKRAFASAIVALGGALDKFVVAEGIERPEQLALLDSFGCDAGQGYYFARPMDGRALVVWARQWPTSSAGPAGAAASTTTTTAVIDLGSVRSLRRGAEPGSISVGLPMTTGSPGR